MAWSRPDPYSTHTLRNTPSIRCISPPSNRTSPHPAAIRNFPRSSTGLASAAAHGQDADLDDLPSFHQQQADLIAAVAHSQHELRLGAEGQGLH
ncbi:MAG: hypothetical protein AMJ93_10165 [Anaerolineae bacterium SM23_84]|nr:MAG: hypothetical protein AMJ93_10165 [Anaerolineae bacterium SM23_84]